MKRILIFTMVMLLQNGFCSNISKAANYNNDELVQKMSKDKDVTKFFKLVLARRLSEDIAVENVKKGITISIEQKGEFEKLTNKTNIALEKIIDKYPELNTLPIDKKNEVMRAVASLSYFEVITCLGAPIGGICGAISGVEKAVLATCLGIAAGADMIAAYFTAGGSSAVLLPVVTAETSYCASFAVGSSYAACFVTVLSSVIVCLQDEAGD
jgi:hypothetical protein